MICTYSRQLNDHPLDKQSTEWGRQRATEMYFPFCSVLFYRSMILCSLSDLHYSDVASPLST